MKFRRAFSFALALSSLGVLACGDPDCEDLVYNSITETCDCPLGTYADRVMDRCVPLDGGVDASMMDGAITADAGIGDGGRDMAEPDLAMELDVGPDAGPAPVPTMARYPWNGLTTGSVHVASDSPAVNHPLRPKLMWEESADADHYQVQMTRECAVTGFRACAFTSPELDEATSETIFRPSTLLPVSMTAPVGDRYFWRVRSCSATDVCSDWTMVRYLDVGRSDDDFNGDGYGDLVAGRVIYNGSASGLPLTPTTTLSNPTGQADGGFGIAAASAGDLNADGFADLVIGAFHQNGDLSDSGAGFVYFGGADGVGAAPSVTVHGNQTGSWFGRGVGGGDLNGDGHSDLLIGAPFQDAPDDDEGIVFVYLFDEDTNAAPSPSVVLDNPADTGEQAFGWTVTTGDFDGDGYADLSVGAVGQSAPEEHEGNAFLFHGSIDGLETSPFLTLDNPRDDMYAEFSAAMRVGDLNGDGYADLAIGAYLQNAPAAQEGSVFVYVGGVTMASEPSVSLRDPGSQRNAAFGFALAIGDTNGDGLDDLTVGESVDRSAMTYPWSNSRNSCEPRYSP